MYYQEASRYKSLKRIEPKQTLEINKVGYTDAIIKKFTYRVEKNDKGCFSASDTEATV